MTEKQALFWFTLGWQSCSGNGGTPRGSFKYAWDVYCEAHEPAPPQESREVMSKTAETLEEEHAAAFDFACTYTFGGPQDKGTCAFAGPGRGDCAHAVGLPGLSIPGQHDGPDDTKDEYDKPNGWCWFCYLSRSVEEWKELHALECEERNVVEAELKQLLEHRDNILKGGRCVPCVRALEEAAVKVHMDSPAGEETREAIDTALNREPIAIVVTPNTKPICTNATPKRCNDDYHPPECESLGLHCLQVQLYCKTCKKTIDVGNCCSEVCTRLWVAGLHFSDDPRLCRRCASPHEMKSNYCGQCDKVAVCGQCAKAHCEVATSATSMAHCAYCWRVVAKEALGGECGQWCPRCVEREKNRPPAQGLRGGIEELMSSSYTAGSGIEVVPVEDLQRLLDAAPKAEENGSSMTHDLLRAARNELRCRCNGMEEKESERCTLCHIRRYFGVSLPALAAPERD